MRADAKPRSPAGRSRVTEGPYKGSPGWMKLQVDLDCTHQWRAWTLRSKWLTVTAEGKRGVLFNGGMRTVLVTGQLDTLPRAILDAT